MFIPSATKSKAYTLIEVIVASAIALMVLGVIIQMMIASGRVAARGQLIVELQQKSMILVNKLERDIHLTNKNGLAIDLTPAENRLFIHRKTLETSVVTWEPTAILYTLRQGVLRREVLTLNPVPTQVFRPTTPIEWTTVLGSPRQTVLELQGATNFTLTMENDSLARLNLSFQEQDVTKTTTRLLPLRQGT